MSESCVSCVPHVYRMCTLEAGLRAAFTPWYTQHGRTRDGRREQSWLAELFQNNLRLKKEKQQQPKQKGLLLVGSGHMN